MKKTMEYIIIGSIVLIVFIFLLLIIKVETLRNKANALFLEAEKNITDSKFNYVCANLYTYLPSMAKLFISDEAFRELVQKLYDSSRELAHDLLDDGKRNKSNK